MIQKNKDKIKELIPFCYIPIIFLLSRYYTMPFMQGTFTRVYSILSIIVTVFFAIKFICVSLNKNIIKDNKILVAIGIFVLVFLIITLCAENGEPRYLMSAMYPIVGTACFIASETKKHPKEVLSAYAIWNLTLLATNLIEGLSFRDNSYNYATVYYFLGGQTQFGVFSSIAWATINAYAVLTKKGSWLEILTMGLLVGNACMMQAGTTYVTVAVLLMISIIGEIKKRNYPKTILVLYIIGWLCLVIFRLQFLFSGIIEGLLNKELDLTFRTTLWDKALALIHQNPFFGFGFLSTGEFISFIYPGDIQVIYMSPHNAILQLACTGGITMVILLMAVYLVAFKDMDKKSDIGFYFLIGTVGVLIVYSTESPSYHGLFLMMILGYYYNRFEKDKYLSIKNRNRIL